MPIDMEREARALRTALAERGLTHLRVTKRGKALTILSGREDDPDPEARLTLLEPTRWRLDLPHHSGRWDQTPLIGQMTDMVDAAASIGRLDDFGGP